MLARDPLGIIQRQSLPGGAGDVQVRVQQIVRGASVASTSSLMAGVSAKTRGGKI